MNEAVFLSALIGIGIALLFIRLAALERRLNRLSRVDAKIDALLKNAAVEFDECENVPADVREALEQGDRILAIRRLRAATGMGLKEAKEFVDEVRRRKVVSG